MPVTARTAETTNYEVSKTTRRVLQPPGDVARLSVAVILDDDHVQQKSQDGTVSTVRQARKTEEIQKINGLTERLASDLSRRSRPVM